MKTAPTDELALTMMEALAGRSACLLANHGMICHGPTVAKALWLAVEVETLAQQYWAARQIGEPVLLSTAEIESILERFQSYGKQAGEMPEDSPLAKLLPVRR
ncbi:MAG: class II aldolase/adducin family protein [Pseudomonadota bacterium]